MSTIKIGTADVSAVYAGTTRINKLYVGAEEIWSSMPEPIVHFDFNEGAGNTHAVDSKSYFPQLVNDGAESGWGPGTTTSQMSWYQVNTPQVQYSTTGSWTIVLVMKFASVGDYELAVMPSDDNTQYLWLSTGKWSFYSQPTNNISSPDTLTTDTWHTLAMTYNSADTTARLYVDGLFTVSATGAVHAPYTCITGSNDSWLNQGSVGELDDFKVWDVALTDAQIATLS